MTNNTYEFWSGVRRGVPIIISAGPFGILFGAVAADNGLTIWEAFLMSATVFAGASQIVGIELFGQDVPAWLIILSVFAVNFRHVLYSAAMSKYIRHYSTWQKASAFFLLTDPQFAETVRESEGGRKVSYAWYLGMGMAMFFPWTLLSLLGAVLGGFIGDPKAIGLDVLLPVYFLGLVMGFRKRPNWLPVVVASAVGSIAGIYLFGSPWHVTAGAITGVVFAALLPLKDDLAGNEAGDAALAGEDV